MKTEKSTKQFKKEDGSVEWRTEEGILHRENDLPAVIFSNGTMFWYKDGKRHRDNGQPAVVWCCGKHGYWIEGRFIKADNRGSVE